MGRAISKAGQGSPPGQTAYVRGYDLTAAHLKAEYSPEPQGACLFLCSALLIANWHCNNVYPIRKARETKKKDY
jgi:hypothetical protein